MKNINANLIAKLENTLSESLMHKWQGVRARVNGDRKIKIANTGLVSSGKSSLFNVLIGADANNPRFAIGAARTTSVQDIEDFSEKIVLADTPGIDVNDDDNKIALESILESDIIIMIHNIKLGALTASEYEWLKSIAERMNTESERKSRLIFICSWIDERDGNPDYNHTVNETRNMVRKAVGCEIDFYEISVKRYLAGIQKNKEILINKSNIPVIKNAIIKKALDYSVVSQELIANELYTLCTESREYLLQNRDKLFTERYEIINTINRKYHSILTAWKSAINVFKKQYKTVKDKKQELDGMY